MKTDFPAFLVHRELYQGTRRLSDGELGKLFRGMMQYAFAGELPDLNGREGLVFDMVQQAMDEDRERYESKAEANRENGKRGGRPKKTAETQENQTVLEITQENQTVFSETHKNPQNPITTINNNSSSCSSSIRAREGFIGDEEAFMHQRAISAVLDAAERAGFAQDTATMDKLTDLAAEHGAETVVKAIDVANNQGKSSLAYLRGILSRWKENGGPTDKRPEAPRPARKGTPLDVMEGAQQDDV